MPCRTLKCIYAVVNAFTGVNITFFIFLVILLLLLLVIFVLVPDGRRVIMNRDTIVIHDYSWTLSLRSRASTSRTCSKAKTFPVQSKFLVLLLLRRIGQLQRVSQS
jgi:hypothetical protein